MTATNSKPPPGVGLVPPDFARDMAAFDALPPEAREALREAPYEMAATYAEEVGVEAFMEEYAGDTAGFVPPRVRPRRARAFR